jgi:hypothetical protein
MVNGESRVMKCKSDWNTKAIIIAIAEMLEGMGKVEVETMERTAGRSKKWF